MSIARIVDEDLSRLSGLDLLEAAIARHNPTHIFSLFSGGHDSLCATHLVSRHPQFTGAVHINTGIGIEFTREFVRSTCKNHGWPLKEYRAKEDCGQDFEAMVLANGFPGPPQHRIMYTKLKERCLRLLVKDHKVGRHNRIILISGARTEESVRRMGTVNPCVREQTKIWVTINHDWTKTDVEDYIISNGLKRNLIVEALCMSGECLCGAFAHFGELQKLADLPEAREAYMRIVDLQKRVRAEGFPWDWEQRPPKWWDDRSRSGQGVMLELLDQSAQMELPMCHTCNERDHIRNRSKTV